MNFFTGIFQGFCLVSSNTYLKNPFEWLLSFISMERLTRKYIFPRKILLLGVFKCENTTLLTLSRGVLISWREYSFTSK